MKLPIKANRYKLTKSSSKMSLQDRLGSMIHCVFAIMLIFLLSALFSICWCSVFVAKTKSDFFREKDSNQLLHICAIVACTTSVLTFVSNLLFYILMVFLAELHVFHFTTIALFLLSFVTHIVFLILIITKTTTSKEQSVVQYYISDIITKNRDDTVEDWFEEHKCNNRNISCNSAVENYFHSKFNTAFIVTSIDIFAITIPIIILVIVVIIMSFIQPADESDDIPDVASTFLNEFTTSVNKVIHHSQTKIPIPDE